MGYITNEDGEYAYGYGPEEPKLMPAKKKKVMKTKPAPYRFNAEDVMAPLKMDFETFEEYEELRDEVEQRITFMRMEAYDLERKSMLLEQQAKDLDDQAHALASRSGELEDWERSVLKAKENIDRRSETLDQQHTALKMVADRLETANRPALEVINDVLLQLELEVDPIKIAKAVREIGKSLDVKW